MRFKHRCNLQFQTIKYRNTLNEFQRFIYFSFLCCFYHPNVDSIRVVRLGAPHFVCCIDIPFEKALIVHFVFRLWQQGNAFVSSQARFTISSHSIPIPIQFNAMHCTCRLIEYTNDCHLTHHRHKSTYSIYLSLLSISCYNWLSSSLNKLRCFIMREKSIGKETDGDDDDDDYR